MKSDLTERMKVDFRYNTLTIIIKYDMYKMVTFECSLIKYVEKNSKLNHCTILNIYHILSNSFSTIIGNMTKCLLRRDLSSGNIFHFNYRDDMSSI